MSQDFLVPENLSSVIVWLTTESTRESTPQPHKSHWGWLASNAGLLQPLHFYAQGNSQRRMRGSIKGQA